MTKSDNLIIQQPERRNFVDADGRYICLTEKNTKDFVNNVIMKNWEAFVRNHDKSLVMDKDMFVNKRNIIEVAHRVDKRKAYYSIFHTIDNTSECREIGLLSYWICTLKPFFVAKEESPLYGCPNEMFVLYLMMAMIKRIFLKQYPDEKFKPLNERLIKELVNKFKYCDMSREAMIACVELLAKSYDIVHSSLDSDDASSVNS